MRRRKAANCCRIGVDYARLLKPAASSFLDVRRFLEEFFGEEPIYIPVSSDAGGIEAAINALLVAMRQRLPADVPAVEQPKAQPLEELVLELTDLKFHEQDGVRRPSKPSKSLARSPNNDDAILPSKESA